MATFDVLQKKERPDGWEENSYQQTGKILNDDDIESQFEREKYYQWDKFWQKNVPRGTNRKQLDSIFARHHTVWVSMELLKLMTMVSNRERKHFYAKMDG